MWPVVKKYRFDLRKSWLCVIFGVEKLHNSFVLDGDTNFQRECTLFIALL